MVETQGVLPNLGGDEFLFSRLKLQDGIDQRLGSLLGKEDTGIRSALGVVHSDRLQGTAMAVGDHRSAERLGLDRDNAEIFIGSEKESPGASIQVPELRARYPPDKLDRRPGDR